VSGLLAIMDELAATLEADIDSVEQVTPRMNFKPTPPSIDIYPGDPFRTDEGAAFQDVNGMLVFTVRARIATPDNEAAQDVLLGLMDDESDQCVAAVLQYDQTLNGLASSVEVEGPSGYQLFIDSGGEGALLGVTWQVNVLNLIT